MEKPAGASDGMKATPSNQPICPEVWICRSGWLTIAGRRSECIVRPIEAPAAWKVVKKASKHAQIGLAGARPGHRENLPTRIRELVHGGAIGAGQVMPRISAERHRRDTGAQPRALGANFRCSAAQFSACADKGSSSAAAAKREMLGRWPKRHQRRLLRKETTSPFQHEPPSVERMSQGGKVKLFHGYSPMLPLCDCRTSC